MKSEIPTGGCKVLFSFLKFFIEDFFFTWHHSKIEARYENQVQLSVYIKLQNLWDIKEILIKRWSISLRNHVSVE